MTKGPTAELGPSAQVRKVSSYGSRHGYWLCIICPLYLSGEDNNAGLNVYWALQWQMLRTPKLGSLLCLGVVRMLTTKKEAVVTLKDVRSFIASF